MLASQTAYYFVFFMFGMLTLILLGVGLDMIDRKRYRDDHLDDVLFQLEELLAMAEVCPADEEPEYYEDESSESREEKRS